MSNTNMEFETWELLQKFLDEIEILEINYFSEIITAEQFIKEINYLKNFYQNEIH